MNGILIVIYYITMIYYIFTQYESIDTRVVALITLFVISRFFEITAIKA